MYARTYYNTLFTQVFAGAFRALAAPCVLFFLISCSSHTTLSDIEEDIPEGTDPMKFTCQLTQDAQTSRASSLLTSDFKVCTYKAYATPNQQTVMDNYHVEYKTSGTAWNGTERPYWDYTQVPGQYVRYWDYSHFPYRFHAIAPYRSSTTGYTVDINDKNLNINATYACQTCVNGLVQPADMVAEPFTVAQLHRDTDGKDHDLLAIDESNSELNNSTTTKHREVWMPFHHLNSKIRFAVYSLAPWASANSLYIENLTVKVTSHNFATSATGYKATCQGTGTNDDPYIGWRVDPPYSTTGFQGITLSPTTGLQLFRFDGGRDVPGNDLTECQTQKTAYFMLCKDGIMQIPQQDVSLSVSFLLYKADGTLYQTFTDVPVEYELDGIHHPLHTWQSGYIYTYYLVLGANGNVPDQLEIEFTCTLTPWEDISGSLSTDLEQ